MDQDGDRLPDPGTALVASNDAGPVSSPDPVPVTEPLSPPLTAVPALPVLLADGVGSDDAETVPDAPDDALAVGPVVVGPVLTEDDAGGLDVVLGVDALGLGVGLGLAAVGVVTTLSGTRVGTRVVAVPATRGSR